MCGIIAVVRRPSGRRPAKSSEIAPPLVAAVAALQDVTLDLVAAVERAAGLVEGVDSLLRGTAGVRTLLGDPDLLPTVDAAVADALGTLLVSAAVQRTRSKGTPSSSATSCAILVFTPWPISVPPWFTWTLPSV